MAIDVADGLGDDHMIGIPPAGQSDVEVFAVEAGAGEQDRVVDGGALRGGDVDAHP